MHRRLHSQLAAIALLPLLAGGCVQMTRHSNMMIFGTNTVVGIRAGVNATSVPEVSIGFTRQEAVVLPLVANVAEGKDSALLKPCDVGAKVDIVMHGAPDAPFPVHPCLLVATNGAAKDSYSVLASFGGKFTAANSDGKPEAQAGVAQYFATGVAAQLLALKGGAAVVAVSAAATGAAATPVDQSAVRALFGGKPQPYSASLITGRAFPTFQADLLAKISTGSDATVGPSLKAFEEEAKIGTNVYLSCTSKVLCMTKAGNDAFLDVYHDHAGDMEDALKKWK